MLVSASDALEEVEDSLDSLAASLAGAGGGSVPRATLETPVARLATMRRWVRAGHAVFQRVGLDIGALSRFDEPEEPYLDRLDEQADACWHRSTRPRTRWGWCSISSSTSAPIW